MSTAGSSSAGNLYSPDPHPEEWTLVGVHNMEKREDYHMWKNDIQASILNCAKQLNSLMQVHAHPSVNMTRAEMNEDAAFISEQQELVKKQAFTFSR